MCTWEKTPATDRAALGFSSFFLVPKLCLGTHGLEAPLRVSERTRENVLCPVAGTTKQSFVAVRSQAELGNEEGEEGGDASPP
jgi:hypothetical protein